MKLTTLALASVFALPALAFSSTFAHAYTNPNHHRSGVRTHHGAVRMNYAPTYRGWMNYGGYNRGPMNYGGDVEAGRYGNGPNNRGGLVGGDDDGT
jgi:hypothetical protein